MTELNKAQLRTRVRTLFPTVPDEALAVADRRIEQHLIELLQRLSLRGAVLGGYQPIRRPTFKEPAINWQTCQQLTQLQVAFPLVDRGQMVYRDAAGEACVPSALVIPAVGYDPLGYRLGHGAGNFDQYLAQHSVQTTIGVVYAWQIINSIPTDAWDLPVGWVVTDQEIRKIAATERSHTGRN